MEKINIKYVKRERKGREEKGKSRERRERWRLGGREGMGLGRGE